MDPRYDLWSSERRPPSRPSRPPHYYGDAVRGLLLACGVIILLSIPFDLNLLVFHLVVGVALVFVLVVLAGLTSPRNQISLAMDVVIAAVLFFMFEYLAIAAFVQMQSLVSPVFILRQLTALTALLALYFSIKTLRRMVMEPPRDKTVQK